MGGLNLSAAEALAIYNTTRKYFTLLSCVVITPVTLFINAPFGRFAPQHDKPNEPRPKNFLQTFLAHPALMINGRVSWVIMEIVSPVFFILTYLSSPLSPNRTNLNFPFKPTLLSLLFLTHYLNRSLISPLVFTPSRSKSHILVPLVGILFNITNGSLLGSYLSSETAISYLLDQKPTSTFWLGVGLWLVGILGNIYHDEILFEIRRKANSKGKYKEERGEHYAIPTGGLYALVSYPNYFCEWLEWLGFAIAAAPFPFPTDFAASSILTSPSQRWLPSLTPPYIFLINLICLMLPRAYRGHQWYTLRFGDRYPKERRAVIPFVL